jgi:hypothetical protein
MSRRPKNEQTKSKRKIREIRKRKKLASGGTQVAKTIEAKRENETKTGTKTHKPRTQKSGKPETKRTK